MPYTPKHETPDPRRIKRESFGRRRWSNQHIYNSPRWRKVRLIYLKQNPLCVKCYEKGKIVPAKVVDHIIPINAGGAIWDPTNWQSLCSTCHNQKSGREGAAVTNKKNKS